jgi:ribose 5-phosphate isomerase RpiB
MAEEILGAWLSASFEGGRHAKRIEKLTFVQEKK